MVRGESVLFIHITGSEDAGQSLGPSFVCVQPARPHSDIRRANVLSAVVRRIGRAGAQADGGWASVRVYMGAAHPRWSAGAAATPGQRERAPVPATVWMPLVRKSMEGSGTLSPKLNKIFTA